MSRLTLLRPFASSSTLHAPLAPLASVSRRTFSHTSFASQSAPPIPSSSKASASQILNSGRYFVQRTESGELPVYTDIRNGGNNCRTIVRKVTGDVHALQADLNQFFAEGHMDPLKPAPVVTMRPTNKHLEVRGRWVEEVKAWLETRGF